jgi:hypothetical protein
VREPLAPAFKHLELFDLQSKEILTFECTFWQLFSSGYLCSKETKNLSSGLRAPAFCISMSVLPVKLTVNLAGVSSPRQGILKVMVVCSITSTAFCLPGISWFWN